MDSIGLPLPMKTKDRVIKGFHLADQVYPDNFFSLKELRKINIKKGHQIIYNGLLGVVKALEKDGLIESDRVKEEYYDAGRWVTRHVIKYRIRK